jgi:hypothetical protein
MINPKFNQKNQYIIKRHLKANSYIHNKIYQINSIYKNVSIIIYIFNFIPVFNLSYTQ